MFQLVLDKLGFLLDIHDYVALHWSKDIIIREYNNKQQERKFSSSIEHQHRRGALLRMRNDTTNQDGGLKTCQASESLALRSSQISHKSFKCRKVRHNALLNKCKRNRMILELQRLRSSRQTHRQIHTHKPTTITLCLCTQVNKTKFFF